MKYAKHIKIGNENMAIHSFDTEKDLKLCEKAIERALNIMASMSFSELIALFEPYRKKIAKAYDKEVEEENAENMPTLR